MRLVAYDGGLARRPECVVATGSQQQREVVRRWARGKAVLELGCADGCYSLREERIAGTSARFCGIDLSGRAIARARATARSLGLRHCHFDAMNAEHLTFPDNTFDLVFGRGIIHHLDLERSFAELQRVLRPEGRAVFYEPMGHIPLLGTLQSRAPHAATPSEHPLIDEDFRLASRFFERLETRFFGRPPYVGRDAWFVLLTFTK